MKKMSKEDRKSFILFIGLTLVTFGAFGLIYGFIKCLKTKNFRYLVLLIPFILLFVVSGCALSENSTSPVSPDKQAILAQLVTYTNEKSPGPTKDYYWNNGKAKLSGFDSLKAGDYSFSADSQGRSSTARAVLTYSEYKASEGSRQGEPLDPPFYPKNYKVAISYSLTGKTYHGYLYNRSHSIADSLLGKGSYTSKYNFTTGTRSQNVGADQNGGMRAAEELATNYWKSHPSSSATIQYQTTPLYSGDETIPRGSIVDEKSSDGTLDVEIIVINDAEGITINYNSGK